MLDIELPQDTARPAGKQPINEAMPETFDAAANGEPRMDPDGFTGQSQMRDTEFFRALD
jgi:hypothetical protein